MASMMAVQSARCGTSRTKLRSILMVSKGKLRGELSEAKAVPKSSSAMRTPRARNLCSVCSVEGSSRSSTNSVISSSRRSGRRRERDKALLTVPNRSEQLNCDDDRFTVTPIVLGHTDASLQAC